MDKSLRANRQAAPQGATAPSLDLPGPLREGSKSSTIGRDIRALKKEIKQLKTTKPELLADRLQEKFKLYSVAQLLKSDSQNAQKVLPRVIDGLKELLDARQQAKKELRRERHTASKTDSGGDNAVNQSGGEQINTTSLTPEKQFAVALARAHAKNTLLTPDELLNAHKLKADRLKSVFNDDPSAEYERIYTASLVAFLYRVQVSESTGPPCSRQYTILLLSEPLKETSKTEETAPSNHIPTQLDKKMRKRRGDLVERLDKIEKKVDSDLVSGDINSPNNTRNKTADFFETGRSQVAKLLNLLGLSADTDISLPPKLQVFFKLLGDENPSFDAEETAEQVVLLTKTLWLGVIQQIRDAIQKRFPDETADLPTQPKAVLKLPSALEEITDAPSTIPPSNPDTPADVPHSGKGPKALVARSRNSVFSGSVDVERSPDKALAGAKLSTIEPKCLAAIIVDQVASKLFKQGSQVENTSIKVNQIINHSPLKDHPLRIIQHSDFVEVRIACMPIDSPSQDQLWEKGLPKAISKLQKRIAGEIELLWGYPAPILITTLHGEPKIENRPELSAAETKQRPGLSTQKRLEIATEDLLKTIGTRVPWELKCQQLTDKLVVCIYMGPLNQRDGKSDKIGMRGREKYKTRLIGIIENLSKINPGLEANFITDPQTIDQNVIKLESISQTTLDHLSACIENYINGYLPHDLKIATCTVRGNMIVVSSPLSLDIVKAILKQADLLVKTTPAPLRIEQQEAMGLTNKQLERVLSLALPNSVWTQILPNNDQLPSTSVVTIEARCSQQSGDDALQQVFNELSSYCDSAGMARPVLKLQKLPKETIEYFQKTGPSSSSFHRYLLSMLSEKGTLDARDSTGDPNSEPGWIHEFGRYYRKTYDVENLKPFGNSQVEDVIDAITVDPQGAKLLEDAISIRANDDGTYTFDVHFLDVRDLLLHNRLAVLHAIEIGTKQYDLALGLTTGQRTQALDMLPRSKDLAFKVGKVTPAITISFTVTEAELNRGETIDLPELFEKACTTLRRSRVKITQDYYVERDGNNHQNELCDYMMLCRAIERATKKMKENLADQEVCEDLEKFSPKDRRQVRSNIHLLANRFIQGAVLKGKKDAEPSGGNTFPNLFKQVVKLYDRLILTGPLRRPSAMLNHLSLYLKGQLESRYEISEDEIKKLRHEAMTPRTSVHSLFRVGQIYSSLNKNSPILCKYSDIIDGLFRIDMLSQIEDPPELFITSYEKIPADAEAVRLDFEYYNPATNRAFYRVNEVQKKTPSSTT
ncbi:MAG: hypothetical protein ACK5GN_07270 [Pseudomonadota bacterium]|jgi:hypothetical protein